MSKKGVKTDSPTTTPTMNPTNILTETPTFARTMNPTNIPTETPTFAPTMNPTNIPTETPIFAPTMNPTNIPTETPKSFCRYLWEQDDTLRLDLPREEAIQIVATMGGNPNSPWTFQHDLLSKQSCLNLIEFSEQCLESDLQNERNLYIGQEHWILPDEASWYSFDHKNTYNKKISAKELLEMIGREETLNLIDFFHKNCGYDQKIDCMYIGRHGSPDEHQNQVYYAPWHLDDYTTVEVVLNADEVEGGDILHITNKGVQTHESFPGTALTHGHDSVHGATPQLSGTQYMLIIKHHFNRTDKPTILSREIVEELTAAGIGAASK